MICLDNQCGGNTPPAGKMPEVVLTTPPPVQPRTLDDILTFVCRLTHIFNWLNCTPAFSVAMLVLQKFVFLWRSTKEVRCHVRRDLSSVQRKTAKKEAWRPKCAAPRLCYEQNQMAIYHCSYLGHQNEVSVVGGISERCLTSTTHHPPTFSVKRCAAAQNPRKVGGWV